MNRTNIEKRLERVTARGVLGLPPAVARLLAGAPRRDGERTLDPRIQLLFRLGKASGNPPLRHESVASSRKHFRGMTKAADTPVAVPITTRDDVLNAGGRRIPVRAYHPSAFKETLPFVLFFHGGGFVIGDLETHDVLCRRIAAGAGAAVVSVDYRLAPEHPFPAGVEDCRAALDAIRANPSPFAVDAQRGALCGDSAGGNLAAVVSQGAGLKGQLLYYPGTDASSKSDSKRLFSEGLGIEGEDIRWFIHHYAEGVDRREPELSPRYSETLGDSPRTRVVVAGFDPLRDEGRDFAHALVEAGVDVELVEHSAWVHGYLHMGALPGVANAIQADALRLGSWLRT